MAVPLDSSGEVVDRRTGFDRVGFECLIYQSSSTWEYLQSIRKPLFYTTTFRDCQQLAFARHEGLEGSVLCVRACVCVCVSSWGNGFLIQLTLSPFNQMCTEVGRPIFERGARYFHNLQLLPRICKITCHWQGPSRKCEDSKVTAEWRLFSVGLVSCHPSGA